MIKKYKLTDCAEGLWRNSQGKTRQIAIFPPESTMAEGNFDWRLSSATILGDNSFSQFNGFDRWLVVWKGDGIILNNKKLLPHSPLHFHGEESMDCSLIDNEVVDVGLIYNRNKIKAQLNIIMGSINVEASDKTTVLFHDDGQIVIVKNENFHLELSPRTMTYQFLIEHL